MPKHTVGRVLVVALGVVATSCGNDSGHPPRGIECRADADCGKGRRCVSNLCVVDLRSDMAVSDAGDASVDGG